MNAWRLSPAGLRTVVELELKQRVRSRRWIWALVGWFVGLGAVTSLVIWATTSLFELQNRESSNGVPLSPGPLAFGLITYLVLGLGLMIAPAFTATSINGDRAAGTLATLQATRLSAVDIACGKLISAWLTAAVFMVVASPFIAWSMVLGSISVWQVFVVFLVVLVEIAVVCAIGLGWSAIISRAAGAAAMTYLSVIALTVFTVMVFGLAAALTVGTPQTERVWGLTDEVVAQYENDQDAWFAKHPDSDQQLPAPVDKCTWFTRQTTSARADRVWWLLVSNPFIVVADAAPLPPGVATDLTRYQGLSVDPLASIRYGVRQLSLPPADEVDECSQYYSSLPGYTTDTDAAGNFIVRNSRGEVVNVSPVKIRPVSVATPVWPWGLGFHVGLGALFFWIAVRRLSVPYRRLPRGTRVA